MRKSYVALAYLLVFCLISSSVSFADTIPNATGAVASDVQSDHVMTSIKLNGKAPEEGQFTFNLLKDGVVVDTAENDADGNVFFLKKKLAEENANYTIQLVTKEEDKDKIIYGETSKNVNVVVKEAEEQVGNYDNAIDFYATNDAVGNIKVHYKINGKEGSTTAYCINTDVGLKQHRRIEPIKDPDDETLAKYIVSQFYDWEGTYADANRNGKTVAVGAGMNTVDIQHTYKFKGYAYDVKTNNIVSELQTTYNTSSISDLLRKALYYNEYKFNPGSVQVDRYRDGKNAYGYSVQAVAEKDLKNPYYYNRVKQNMVWAVTGGMWGRMRVHYRYDGAIYQGREVHNMVLDEQYSILPANFKSHMQKVVSTVQVPENYHVMIFRNDYNPTQPVAFGYLDDGSGGTRKVKKTFVNVPEFECRTNEKTKIEITKNWIGKAADSITLRLKDEAGNIIEKVVNKNDSNVTKTGDDPKSKWVISFEVPKYANVEGAEKTYTLDDEKDLNGYKKDVDKTSNTVTNTQTKIIKITKKWLGKVGDTVTIYLLKGAQTLQDVTENTLKVTLNKANFTGSEWTYTFENLAKYDADGKEIAYKVEEGKTEGYKKEIKENQKDDFTVTNTEQAKIKVNKKWIGKEGDSITIKIKNEKTGALIKEIKLTKDTEGLNRVVDSANSNIVTWETTIELDKVDTQGAPITFTAEESDLSGYVKDVKKDSDTEFTIVNIEKVLLKATKNWVGADGSAKAPSDKVSEIKVHLLQEGVSEPLQTKTVTKAENAGKTTWEIAFDAVPKYDASGNEIKYEVKEDAVAGYDTTVDGFTITNKEKERLKVIKTWVGKVGESITITLNNGTTELAPITVTPNSEGFKSKKDGNKTTWEVPLDVEKYGADGTAITYTAKETPINGYDTIVTKDSDNNVVITNIEKVSIGLTKKWLGKNGSAETPKAGTTITVKLMNGSEVVDTKELSLANKAGLDDATWKVEFKAVPKYKQDGTPINYTVEEVNVAGYTTQNSGDVNSGFVITNKNTKDPNEKITISGVKRWIGKAADTVTIYLLKGAQTLQDVTTSTLKVTLNKANFTGGEWTYTFENLAKYDADGNEIAYKVEEDKESQIGYKKEITGNVADGFKITNTEKVKVIKTWIGRVGESITITLNDGTKDLAPITVTPNSEGFKSTTQGNKTIWEVPLDVEKYGADGTAITYTAKETPINGYDTTVTKDSDNNVVITNIEKVALKVTKNWINKDGEAGAVGDTITVHLMKEGQSEPVQTKTVTKAENASKTTWEIAFDAVPKYDASGNEIKYEVKEDAVAGYDTTVDGFTITNKEKPTIPPAPQPKTGSINIKVVKEWIGKVGDEITIYLVKSGDTADKAIETKTIKKNELTDGKWEYTFTADKYAADGSEITYAVLEKDSAGYEKEITGNQQDGFKIINTEKPVTPPQPEKTSISVVKAWIGKVGTAVTVHLIKQGQAVENAVLTAEKNWKHTFTNLTKYDADGTTEIKYEVKEDNVVGYKLKSIVENVKGVFTITNEEEPIVPPQPKPEPEKVALKVTKNWLGADGNPKAPNASLGAITFKLMNGTQVVDTQTVNVADKQGTTWEVAFKEVPKKDEQGNTINYTVEEVKVDGYDTTVNGFTVTNKEKPVTPPEPEKRTLEFTKNWVGKVADEITIYITNNVTNEVITLIAKKDKITSTPDPSNANNTIWRFTFDVPKSVQGQDVTYSIREKELKDYETTVTGDQDKGFVITNIEKPPVTPPDENDGNIVIKVTKNWIGKIGDSIKVRLKNGSKVVEEKVITKSEGQNSEKANWEFTFSEVPKKDADGNLITYTLEEEDIEGYTKAITGDQNSGFVITNTKNPDKPITPPEPKPDPKPEPKPNPNPEPEKVTLKVTKYWVDKDGKEKAPSDKVTSVTFNLMNGTEVVDTQTVTRANNEGKATWEITFKEVPKNDAQGKPINYTVAEAKVDGYDTTVNGFTVTNKEKPVTPDVEKINVKVTKKWLDKDGKAGKVGDEIAVLLKNGNKVVARQVVKKSENAELTTWTIEFKDLPKKDASGKEIIYTVDEEKVSGYIKTVEGNQEQGFTITNKEDPTPKEQIKVIKKWVGKVGQAITITLKNSETGEILENVVVTKETKGLKEIVDTAKNTTIWEIPLEANKYDVKGNAIAYSAQEADLKDYASTVTKVSNTEFAITNIEKIAVKLTKKWIDRNNQPGAIGRAITVSLKNAKTNEVVATKVIKAAELTGGDKSTWEFTVDAPKYDAEGNVVDYIVTEDAVSGYTTQPIKGNISDGFVITNKEIPPTTPSRPRRPSNPTPNTPPTPTYPSYPKDNPPDPNDPKSPPTITVIDEGGVPLGNYKKQKKSDGTEEYVLIDDVVPLAGVLPNTGDDFANRYYMGGFALMMGGLFLVLQDLRRRRKED